MRHVLTDLTGDRPNTAVEASPSRPRVDRLILLGLGLVFAYWLYETGVDAFRVGQFPTLGGAFEPIELLERLPVSALIMIAPALVALRRRAEALSRSLLERERTARTQAEAARARMTEILESITDQFYALDREWRVTYLNAKGEEFLGRTRAQLIGKCLWEAFPQTVGGANYEEYHRAVREERSRVFESESKIRPGRWLEVHAYPSPNGLSVYCRDVTERKKTEQALDESRERYRLMVEGSEAVFFYTHDPDHRFTYLSPSVREVLGYEAAELLGRGYDVVLAEEDSGSVHHWTEQALRTGQGSPAYVARTRHRDGRTVLLELVESPVLRDGQVIGIQGFARDISARAALEEQVRQSQKLDAVGRLAGGVAHDFNNMLTAIRGYTEILGEDLEPGDPRQADVEEIRRTAGRAANLTRQLLAFSRQQVLKPKVVNLNQIIGDLESMLCRLIPEDIELDTNLSPDLAAVRADAGQIGQVILNLVVNAKDAMPDGGRIVVETRNRALSGEPDDGFAYPPTVGSFVEVTVSDTGVGMDEEARSKIFEPFFTTKKEGEGTGLGLSTVYGIVQQSGGYISVHSEPGRGARFSVYLPLAEETERETERQEEEENDVVTPALDETILLVEDEDAVRNVARRLLERRGYTVLTAYDGMEALEVAKRHPGPIDLVLTDVVMPGMSGREMVERLSTLRPEAAIIFMSGYTRDEIIRRGIADHGIHFLEKPFTPFALTRKVRDVLDRIRA